MSECTVCKRPSTQARNKIACSDCKVLCHSQCVNMTKEDIECIVNEKQIWRCPPCAQARRKSMTAVAAAESGTADISHVIFMLEEAEKDRKRIESEMNKAFEYAHELIEEQKKTIETQSNSISEFLQEMSKLKEENIKLKKKVADLELRIEESEQYTRSNTLEIYGIPEDKTEDVYDVVMRVGSALDVNIKRESIDVCHRLGKKQGSAQPAGIIVKMVRREDKLKLLEKRRIKRNFSTKDLGFTQSAVPVYINESLSPARRKLFNAARAAKTEKQYTYLWVRNGKIFMRKNQGDPVIVVSSMESVASLT